MQESNGAQWRRALAAAARNRNVFGFEKVEQYHHALVVLMAIQAFVDDPRATFFMEVRPGRTNIPRPDLILLHPEIGVLVTENKGIALQDIQGVQDTTLSLLRDGRFKREDPFHQAEKVSFRLRDLAAKLVGSLKRGIRSPPPRPSNAISNHCNRHQRLRLWKMATDPFECTR
jgi:hypothetical protein